VIALDESREGGGADPKRRDRCECDGHDSEERQGTFEEKIGEGEPVVLIEDGERQRHRRVVAEQFDGPRRLAPVQLTQVQR